MHLWCICSVLNNKLRFLSIWFIVRQRNTLAEKETPMSGEEQQDQASEGVLLPIDFHVPDTMQKQYVDNVIVQPGRHEITLFFFQTQIPPYTGPAEANSIVSDTNDELEWHRIVHTPHVRNGLRRLAAEARRQIATGETEEGGFAVE